MKKFLAVICSFVLTFTLFCGVILIGLEEFVSKKNIETVVSKININQFLDVSTEQDQDTYDFFNTLGISNEKVDELFNSKSVKNLISGMMNNALDYYLRGEGQSQVFTEEQLDQFLKEFIIACSDDAKLHLTKEEEQKVYDFVRPSLKELQEDLPTVEELKREDPNMVTLITYSKIVLGTKVKVFCLLLIALSALGIYLLRKEDENYLIWYGINSIVASFLLFVFFCFAKLLFSVEMLGTELYEFTILADSFLNKGFMYTSILLIIGILLLMTRHFLKKKGQNNKQVL